MAGVDEYTKLMLHMNGSNGATAFVDSSFSAKTVTRYTNATITTATSKFGGSSASFPAGVGYLGVDDSDDWFFGTDDFTVDFWIQRTVSNYARYVWSQYIDGNNQVKLYIDSTTNVLIFYAAYAGSPIAYFTSTSAVLAADDLSWHHFALVRSGTSAGCLKAYKDGTLIPINTINDLANASMPNLATGVKIGSTFTGNVYFSGYLDELRVSKGIARWTSNFTPPAVAYYYDPGEVFDSYTKLLIHADGENMSAAFIDSSISQHVITAVGNAVISTSQSKFGGSALRMVNDTDYLSVAYSAEHYLGLNDWTVDFWFRYEGPSTDFYVPLSRMDNASPSKGWCIEIAPEIGTAIGKIYFASYNVSGLTALTFNAEIPALTQSTWYHVALVYSSSTPKIFLNGVSYSVTTSTPDTDTNYDANTPLIVGYEDSYAEWCNGYIDELRISKDVARWTSDFTPPTTSYDKIYDIIVDENVEILGAVLAAKMLLQNIDDVLFAYDTSIISSYIVYLSEILDLSDVASAQLHLLVSDFLTAVDSQLIHWNSTKTVTDVLSVYENIKLQLIKTINEALTLTDSSSAMLELILSEFVLLTESVIANWNTTRTVTDSLAISDASIVQLQLLITEALALTDTQVLSLQLALTDFFFSSDNTVPNWNTVRTVTDRISLVDSFTEALQLLITESLDLTDAQFAQLQLTLSEFISVSENVIPNWNTTRILTDSVNIVDLLYQQLSLFLAESLVITDSAPLSQLGLAIYEYLGFTELLTSPGTFSNSLSDELNTVDNIGLGYAHIVSDVLSLVSAADTVRLLLNTIAESVGLSETATSRLNSVLPVSESLVLLDTVTSAGVLYNTVQDILALNLVIELDDEVWECYVLNTPKFMPSIYSGFNFNSYAVFDNRAYGCKSDGVYELIGTTDNGIAINTGVQFSETSFGVPNQKRFRKAYIGVVGSKPHLVTETEKGVTKAYSIDAEGEVDMLRTLRSKKWKLKVTNFNQLDFVKLIPVVLTK